MLCISVPHLSQYAFFSLLALHVGSTAAINSCHNVRNFTQQVDHYGGSQYGNSDATFLQQYQLDISAYKPGGPILFFQGNEAMQMFCIEQLILPSWAKELGAAVATLEHRFFGESVPLSADNDTDPIARFKTLTLDNVMMDAVRFVEWLKSSELRGAKDSKVIVQGASYGAALSSWLRLNHPETFYGAVSSGTPLRGYGYAPDDPANYNWQSWVSHSISRQSADAASKIKAAFIGLQSRIATAQGRAGLQAAFNLCHPVNSTTSGALLLQYLQVTYSLATQFNYANPQRAIGDSSTVIGYPFPFPLERLVNRTLAEHEDMRVLNASLSLYMDQFPGCVDHTLGSPPVPAIETSVFPYVYCSWVTIITIATPDGAIFPPNPIGPVVAQMRAFCKKAYNIDVLSQQEIVKRYKFSQADVENSTRLLIVSGEFDPTSGLAPRAWDSAPNANASRVMYVSQMAHCEDTYKPREGDKETVARNYELQIIKGWLGM